MRRARLRVRTISDTAIWAGSSQESSWDRSFGMKAKPTSSSDGRVKARLDTINKNGKMI